MPCYLACLAFACPGDRDLKHGVFGHSIGRMKKKAPSLNVDVFSSFRLRQEGGASSRRPKASSRTSVLGASASGPQQSDRSTRVEGFHPLLSRRRPSPPPKRKAPSASAAASATEEAAPSAPAPAESTSIMPRPSGFLTSAELRELADTCVKESAAAESRATADLGVMIGAKIESLMQQTGQTIPQIFHEWDENGDGELSKTEFRLACRKLRVHMQGRAQTLDYSMLRAAVTSRCSL